jgi:hypothetical protein
MCCGTTEDNGTLPFGQKWESKLSKSEIVESLDSRLRGNDAPIGV